MKENKVVYCRPCGDPVALAPAPLTVNCSRPCAENPRGTRRNEQLASWICEEYYGGGMTRQELVEKYGVSESIVRRIIEMR